MDKGDAVCVNIQWAIIWSCKGENPAIVTTWINLEGIMVNEISQAEKEDKLPLDICGV